MVGTEATLTFHIVLLPGGLRTHQLFLFSLLKWSACRFRLVANGCDGAEVSLIKEFAAQQDRLEVIDLEFEEIKPHGEVLSLLQDREEGDYFCFMDPDILATDNFVSTLFEPFGNKEGGESRSGETAGVFACTPIWCDEAGQVFGEDNRKMYGRYNRTGTGVELGGTYFAIYDNSIVGRVRREFGVGFEKMQWSDIARANRAIIKKLLGGRVRSLDAGKVLNLMMAHRGYQLQFQNTGSLIHVGGLSLLSMKKELPDSARRDMSSDIGAEAAESLLERLQKYDRKSFADLKITEAEWSAIESIPAAYRMVVAYYVAQLIEDLMKSEDDSAAESLGDQKLNIALGSLTRSLGSIRDEYRERLIR